MTVNGAKKLLREYLNQEGLSYSKLTAKTVSLSDLARTSSVFVTVHGWKPGPAANDVKAFAHAGGFCVDFSW